MKKILLLVYLSFTGSLFAQPGTLDTSFGNNGYSLFGPAGTMGDGYTSICVQPDGKIVCTATAEYGSEPNSPDLIVVTRFNTDGSPDNTFATTISPMGQQHGAWVEDVALQSDGKIITTGVCLTPTGPTTSQMDIFVARFNSNGGLDTTFGSGGKFIESAGLIEGSDYAYSIVAQPDGKIVVAGETQYSDSFSKPFALRLNSNGTLDSTFGANGVVVSDFAGFYPGITITHQFANEITLQQDGKIILAGRTGTGYKDLALTRLNPDGTFDNTFGTSGKAIFEDTLLDNAGLFIQQDGKLVLGIKWANDIGTLQHAIVRFNSNGSLDTAFGNNGKVNVAIAALQYRGNITLQPNGKILTIDDISMAGSVIRLSRFNSDGSIDAGFGTNGYSTFEFPEFQMTVTNELALQEDGKIIAGLTFTYPDTTPHQIGIMRFNGGEGTANIEERAINAFSIYPNPTTNILNISNPESITIDELRITDITGKTVMQQIGNTSQIDVQNLSQGIYFLKIFSENKEHQHKFIKQ